MIIYHIVLPEIWNDFLDADVYEAESLKTEGFIHCSFENQLEGVLERYYAGFDKVLLLEIDSEQLTSKLVNEPSTNDEIYPHIYGVINREAIIGIISRNLKS